MKTKLTLGGLVVILIIILWSLHATKRQPLITASSINTLENDNSPKVSNSATPITETSSSPAKMPVPRRLSPEEQLKELEKRIDAGKNEWRTPIEFYGRVVDENNNAVAGTSVHFIWNDISEKGTSEADTKSDGNGFFSLTGKKGKGMTVYVSKKGYYEYAPVGLSFNYAGENQNFIPDAGNPVVFHLRKKGEGADLIKADFPPFAHVAQLKHDGTPVELDLLNGTTGAGQLKLEFWRDLSQKNPKIFDWKLQLTMSGGFIGTGEQFPFNAPEDGYQSPIIFDMPTNNPDWQGNVNTNYYFQLSDGKYGRMSFEFLPWNGVFTIHSLINPSGSRNLEPR